MFNAPFKLKDETKSCLLSAFLSLTNWNCWFCGTCTRESPNKIYRLYSARRPFRIEQWRMTNELRHQGTQYQLNRFKRHEEIMTNNIIIIELIECLENCCLFIDSVTATNKVLMSSRNGQFPVILIVSVPRNFNFCQFIYIGHDTASSARTTKFIGATHTGI